MTLLKKKSKAKKAWPLQLYFLQIQKGTTSLYYSVGSLSPNGETLMKILPFK
jgi:hypothetical protein